VLVVFADGPGVVADLGAQGLKCRAIASEASHGLAEPLAAGPTEANVAVLGVLAGYGRDSGLGGDESGPAKLTHEALPR